jgi:hypothetical protein
VWASFASQHNTFIQSLHSDLAPHRRDPVEAIALLPEHGVQVEKRSWLSHRQVLVSKETLHGVVINEVIRRVSEE